MYTIWDNQRRNSLFGGVNRLMCFNVWPIGSGIVWRHGLVGVAVALLEEGCHSGSKC